MTQRGFGRLAVRRSLFVVFGVLFLLVASGSALEAGKLMRIAKRGARETVKAALVEYAKREADQSFDAFK